MTVFVASMRGALAAAVLLCLWAAVPAALNTPMVGQIKESGYNQSTERIVVPKQSLITLRLGCNNDAEGYATAFLRRSSDKWVLMSVSSQCKPFPGNRLIKSSPSKRKSKDTIYERKRVFSSDTEDIEYDLIVSGESNTMFNAVLHVSNRNVPLNEPTTHRLSPGIISIHTFQLPNFTDINYRFVDVTVESEDAEVVGKMIVTPSKSQLYKFMISPNESSPEGLRLSFSTFGRIVLSDVSQPALSDDIWIIGIILLNGSLSKTINVTVEYNTDYEYVSKILVLTVVSLFGFILPIFSRYIFNYLNADREITFKNWIRVVRDWFYRGPKGLSYLTGFLAWMLLVSAFQVVNAKWSEMIDTGDRDVCYYNERCYRPYLGYYDVSVNGIASNMCFMVHGAILILSVSLSETSCYALKHKDYDYSIAYSFGMAFIFEGFGSLLYHICPSQIIFQFDTLFMFVISQYIIAALVDGHAARQTLQNYKLGKCRRKSIRIPKMFLFFLGPAYGFNFLGSLHYINPLPPAISLCFFISLALWVVTILIWAAYKASILPERIFKPAVITFFDAPEVVEERKMKKISKCTVVGFLAYALIVVIGYFMVLTGHLVISIFILGELIVAVLIMTAAAFCSLLKDLWVTITQGNMKFSSGMKCLIPCGVVLYLACGMLVAGVSLFFFTILEVTNKSLEPWQSRELNRGCTLNNFYDSHDLWHFFASHALMMIVLVVIQMSKPCRDCYMKYKCYEGLEEGGAKKGAVEGVGKSDFHQEPEVLKVIPLS